MLKIAVKTCSTILKRDAGLLSPKVPTHSGLQITKLWDHIPPPPRPIKIKLIAFIVAELHARAIAGMTFVPYSENICKWQNLERG